MIGIKRSFSPMDVESDLVYDRKRGFNPKSPKSKSPKPKSPKSKSPKKSPPKHTRKPPRRFRRRAGVKKSKKQKKYGGKKSKKARSLVKRRSRRIQYGCKSMRGGGPIFQPVTETLRGIEGGSLNNYNTLMGNDPTRNETIP